ncbi:hypothetical protein D210916BOD24_03830 [Alteromonas sp. D210916BOD_24]|uniref:ATP-binding protein n=1 Tax=Alteromonas sp. D210916BOD_24 TaxID=3157618 RepID=UPI00399D498E
MAVVASCAFLVPLHEGSYDKGLWLRLCVTNLVVSLLIYALASLLEKALVESRKKTLELNRALASEKQASAAQSRFLATMSHEIRTPLNGILGLTDVMLSHEISESARPKLEKIQRSGLTLSRILNDVLDLSKLNAGKLTLEFMPVDLVSICRDCITFYQSLATAKGITLDMVIEPDLQTSVEGDPTRLSQVLNNLISNAIKFTQQGGVTLKLQKGPVSPTHYIIKFSVVDTGDGIAKSEHSKIFEPFTQASNSVNRIHGGTGLGLQIVKSLVEAMGGHIYLTSELGKGSEFQFELPFITVQAPTPVPVTTDARHRFKGRVLVAEDNEINQMVAKSLLEDVGIEVTLACNGKEALLLATTHVFDLILMDLHMPEMNGADAAEALRLAGCRIPIVAFTAAVVNEEINHALACGMDGYLTKPVNKNELYTMLGRYLPVKHD